MTTTKQGEHNIQREQNSLEMEDKQEFRDGVIENIISNNSSPENDQNDVGSLC